MDIQKLEKQAYLLRIKLNKLLMAESKGHAVRYSTPQMKSKLLRLIGLSNHRWLRRHSKLFNIHPVGFAPSPAQPSGVLGQGTNLDGKYYEIECSECDSESCLNCGLVQGVSV